jgi:hypothetical protein
MNYLLTELLSLQNDARKICRLGLRTPVE